MDSPEGIVVGLAGGRVQVRVGRPGGCGSSCTCHDPSQACALETDTNALTVDAVSKLPVTVGDRVAIDVQRFKTAVLLVYGFPVLAFVAPVVILSVVAPEVHDLWKAAAGFFSLSLAFLALKLAHPWLSGPMGPRVEVTRVLGQPQRERAGAQ